MAYYRENMTRCGSAEEEHAKALELADVRNARSAAK